MDATMAEVAYDVAKNQVRSKLTQIRHIIDHQHVDPDEAINYGHVGDLGYVDDQLAQLLVFLKDEEE